MTNLTHSATIELRKNDPTGSEASVKNEIYLSTGCFTGRINGRNPRLLADFYDQIECDGFELMLFDDLYRNLDETIRSYVSLGIRIPVVHMNKRTGDFLSSPGDKNYDAARALIEQDLEIARRVGARRAVFHPWGIPDSDRFSEMLLRRLSSLLAEYRGSDPELMPENCICTSGSPLLHLRKLCAETGCHITLDTRAAAFHAELNAQLSAFLPNGSVGHFHIIDYAGSPHDWEARSVIPQPGEGNVDFRALFDAAQRADYRGSYTMESPHMLPDSVDVPLFNRSLAYIRRLAEGNGQKPI